MVFQPFTKYHGNQIPNCKLFLSIFMTISTLPIFRLIHVCVLDIFNMVYSVLQFTEVMF